MSFFSKGTGRVNSSFERRSRPGGGSSRSYSEQVSAPAHMRAEKRRLILLLLITAVLPPVGDDPRENAGDLSARHHEAERRDRIFPVLFGRERGQRVRRELKPRARPILNEEGQTCSAPAVAKP